MQRAARCSSWEGDDPVKRDADYVFFELTRRRPSGLTVLTPSFGPYLLISN